MLGLGCEMIEKRCKGVQISENHDYFRVKSSYMIFVFFFPNMMRLNDIYNVCCSRFPGSHKPTSSHSSGKPGSDPHKRSFLSLRDWPGKEVQGKLNQVFRDPANLLAVVQHQQISHKDHNQELYLLPTDGLGQQKFQAFIHPEI